MYPLSHCVNRKVWNAIWARSTSVRVNPWLILARFRPEGGRMAGRLCVWENALMFWLCMHFWLWWGMSEWTFLWATYRNLRGTTSSRCRFSLNFVLLWARRGTGSLALLRRSLGQNFSLLWAFWLARWILADLTRLFNQRGESISHFWFILITKNCWWIIEDFRFILSLFALILDL